MIENPLVTTAWLHEHLHDPNLRIVDIRGHVLPATEPPPHYFNHHADYLEAHIPGAVFIDWVHEITDPADTRRHAKIAPPARYAAVMSRAGIGPDTLVVAYDDAHSMFAARLWWSLNYYGHTRVAVLDGGWKQWTAEGRPTTAEIPQIAPAEFTPRPNPAIYRDAAQVAAAQDNPVTILDVRSPDEYAGRASRTERFGHIPAAVNFPAALLYHPDDTLATPAEVRALLDAQGISDDVITYCNAGVSASFAMLALKIAGLKNVAMYDGSWKDWSDSGRPVEKG